MSDRLRVSALRWNLQRTERCLLDSTNDGEEDEMTEVTYMKGHHWILVRLLVQISRNVMKRSWQILVLER